jgi:hypothetical protein
VYDATIDDKEQLGGMGTIFAGKPIARQDIYQDIFRSRAASHKQKAYALYRAVRCYEPTHTNDCGGADVPESTRKAWFNELKKKYADTPWADELRYYW